MNLPQILDDIHAIDSLLAGFEQRYGLLSDTFFGWYQEGHEPAEQTWVLDFSEWAGLCKSRQRLLALYQRELERLKRSGHDLTIVMQQTQKALAA